MRKNWLKLAALLLLLVPSSFGQQTVDDKDIVVTHFEPLTYPAIATTVRISGAVVVKLSLDDGGNVVDATAVSGADLLIRSAIPNAKLWRFKPNAQKAAVIVYVFTFRGVCSKTEKPGTRFEFTAPNIASLSACTLPLSY